MSPMPYPVVIMRLSLYWLGLNFRQPYVWRERSVPAADVCSMDQAINIFFFIDMILNFCTGYVDVEDRVLVMDLRSTSMHYLKSW